MLFESEQKFFDSALCINNKQATFTATRLTGLRNKFDAWTYVSIAP